MENGEKAETNTKNDFVSRIINKTTPSNSTSNITNNSVNVMDNAKNIMDNDTKRNVNSHVTNNNKNNMDNMNSHSNSNVIKKAYNTGKEFMNLGMYMAEGRNYRDNNNQKSKNYSKSVFNENQNENYNRNKEKKTINVINTEIGDENE